MFLDCLQIYEEAGNVVWYLQLFKNFPQLIVIHAIKGFFIVNEAEVDIFRNFLNFSMIQLILAI